MQKRKDGKGFLPATAKEKRAKEEKRQRKRRRSLKGTVPAKVMRTKDKKVSRSKVASHPGGPDLVETKRKSTSIRPDYDSTGSVSEV